MPLLFAVNLLLCFFMLSVFGALDGPLRDLSLRPAAGSLLCIIMAGSMLLEDVQLTSALYANIGGFFVPVLGAIALCAASKKGTRKYLVAMSVFIGIGTYMFNQIVNQVLEATQEYANVFQGLFCLLFASMLDSEAKPVLFMSIVGFHLCDLIGYVVIASSGQSAFLILGDGMKATVMVAFAAGSVILCRVRADISRAWRQRVKRKKVQDAQPQTP
jgi:hypothetical protein